MKQNKPRIPNKNLYNVGRTLSTGVSQKPGIKPLLESPSKTKKPIWVRGIILLMLVLLTLTLVIGVWNARNYSVASQKLFGTANLLEAFDGTQLKGTENKRVNIMIVGYSADDPGHAGAKLTDSIMIVSLSTKNQTGYMLNIPRDLYVAIPEYGHAKINEAYQFGELSEFSSANFSSGGIGILEKVVYDTLGIQVNYHALVNYAAVRDSTDALGGILIDIHSTDPRGIYDPNFKQEEGGALRLPNGVQKIDGQTALRLTRARGATYGSYGLAQSDFDRIKNQQAVFVGLKNAAKWGVLLNPTKNEALLDAVGNNVQTNVQLSEVLPLFRLFRSIPEQSLISVTLRDLNGQNLLQGYTTPAKQSALIPAAGFDDFSEIRTAISNLAF